ncbi:MAG: TerD family protein, partial [Halothiobacillaceae bacterium]|nr:TerD family protein [Halothiobacillaceae bacterium]
MQLNRGQRLALSALTPARSLRVEVALHGVQADVACFGLDAQGHLADERYMIFYNQTTSPCAGVVLSNPTGGASVGFDLILDQLPSSIDRLVFTAALDGAGTLRQLQRGQVVLRANSAEIAAFSLTGQDFDQERAAMLLEMYRKDGTWRISATGQGFNGGLAALVKHFGGEVAEEKPAAS